VLGLGVCGCPDQEVISAFLKTIVAEKVPDVAKHFNSWDHLFTCTSLEMKQYGISVQNRKLILAAREKTRQLAARQPVIDQFVQSQKQARFEADVKASK
jgi:hypothetical protein